MHPPRRSSRWWEDDLVTGADAFQTFGIDEKTLDDLVKRGELVRYEHGGLVFYRRLDLEKIFIESQLV